MPDTIEGLVRAGPHVSVHSHAANKDITEGRYFIKERGLIDSQFCELYRQHCWEASGNLQSWWKVKGEQTHRMARAGARQGEGEVPHF